MKFVIKNTLRIICCVFILNLLLLGCFYYVANFRETLRDTSVSPAGNYELTFIEVGEPAWPFGPARGKFILRDKDGVISTYRFNVSNDGQRISKNNWNVLWQENCAQIIVSGEEQYDKLYTMHFDGTVETETIFS